MLPDIEFLQYEVTDKMFKSLEYLHGIELDKMFDGGAIASLMNLKRKNFINQDEYIYIFECYGTRDISTGDVISAVEFIKDEARKLTINEQLVNINFQEEDTETIVEKITDIIKPLEEAGVEYFMETFKDVLPRSNNVQKSLVTFNHKLMQHNLAVDSNYLCIIGARPATGKTTFSVKLAMENAVNHKVLYVSCEMSKEQIVRKSKDYQFGHDNVFIVEKPSVTIPQLSKMIRAIKPKFIIIDQLNKVVGKGKTEYERFTYVASQLKMLASRLHVPIVCLAQINRSGAEGKRPMLMHLKGSGSLEEEADVVMILDLVPDEANPAKLVSRVYIDKNRSLDGNVGTYDFSFDKQTNKYKEW